MLLLLLTAAAYFYFHWQYLALVKKLKNQPHRRVWLMLLSFLINYLFSAACWNFRWCSTGSYLRFFYLVKPCCLDVGTSDVRCLARCCVSSMDYLPLFSAAVSPLLS